MHHKKSVGSYEAKTHFSALLDSVAHGDQIIITRKGVPVAILAPYRLEKQAVTETITELLAFRKKCHLKGLSIRDMKEEGRRF